MNAWTMDILTEAFSIFVRDFSEQLKAECEMTKVKTSTGETWLNFSTSQISDSPPRFPYMTLIELAGDERGKDLSMKTVNFALIAFQIDWFDNKSESRVRKCMKETIRIMEDMGFTARQLPTPNSKPQEYRMTARFERLMGNGDTL